MHPITRILFPTDFSEDSTRAQGYAEEMARRFGATIVVVHVSEAMAILPGSDMAKEEEITAKRELASVAQTLSAAKVEARTQLLEGVPYVEILRAADREQCDLIVMGTHGSSGLSFVLIGSVAERVVRKASCPVLTVRHPDREFEHPVKR
jgi:nucleotide-binding universal stress UspA family protein